VVAPKEGLAQRAPSSVGIKADDTLIFVIDVRSTPLRRAEGETVTPPADLPKVRLDAPGKPSVTIPDRDPPKELVAQTLVKGRGPAVRAGQSLSVHYRGVLWRNGKTFDMSWDTVPFEFQLGAGNVVKGWDDGLVGQTVGSQVLLIVPPTEGYGDQGNSNA